MSSTFKYVRGDTGPQLKVTVVDDGTDQPVDLGGAVVTLHFRAAGEDNVLFSRQLVIPSNTAAQGVAVVDWDEGDLDQEAGTYEGEIEVVRANGIRETMYDKLKFKIRDDFA